MIPVAVQSCRKGPTLHTFTQAMWTVGSSKTSVRSNQTARRHDPVPVFPPPCLSHCSLLVDSFKPRQIPIVDPIAIWRVSSVLTPHWRTC